MNDFDPNKLKFMPRIREASVIGDYLKLVANQSPGLLDYKNVAQHGGKKGESLYTHIINGVMVLDSLRQVLGLTDTELRFLFTVFTVHDINKDPAYSGQHFTKIAILANFEQQIKQLNLDKFFPIYTQYLRQVTQLAAQHGGHSGGLSLMIDPMATLTGERLSQLLDLIRAVDILDLSHSLEERSHKATFLSYINNTVVDIQYAFYLHSLAEDRGTLSNMIHHGIVTTLHGADLTPLLYYSDGVAYLMRRDQALVVDASLRRSMAQKTALLINDLIGQEFESFVVSAIAGIKVDPKCLELGISFEAIWNTIHTRVQTRNLKREILLEKILGRVDRNFKKNAEEFPKAAAFVREKLDDPQSLIPANIDRLRDGELIRSYYIFLNKHFSKEVPDAWGHIYNLFDIADEARAWLPFFDSLWDRSYVLMPEIEANHEAIYEIIENDGSELLSAKEFEDDKVDLFDDYLARYALFGQPGNLRQTANSAFNDHLQHYVSNQHKQCVHCSTIFSTDKWMTNDVRSDITVQTFSNRLRGGPGEPKKNICRLCQLQFLVERLNFEEVHNEKTMYLHFFPYSFLPAPYLTAMRQEIDSIRRSDSAVRALWCDTHAALSMESQGVDPDFATRTKKGKPHPYGIYMPRIPRNTIGNRLVFPINPAGDNDSQRFLFALWNALVLQKHLGLRVVLSESPVAPFVPTVDLYIDNVALSCRGLVERNDYPEFADNQRPEGERPLNDLHTQARALHYIADRVRTIGGRDEILALVQTMANGPLSLYYTTEKLLESRVRDRKVNSPEWLKIHLSQQIFPELQILIHSKGGLLMAELSDHLQRLAEIAWQGGLRGKTLKKNSLMTPLSEIFQKLNQRSQAFDDEALKATIAEDIFEYLVRIADEKYQPGRRKMNAAIKFVEIFFNDVFHGSYQGNRTRLLADEKMLRSAYMFYIRQQIPSKQADPA